MLIPFYSLYRWYRVRFFITIIIFVLMFIIWIIIINMLSKRRYLINKKWYYIFLGGYILLALFLTVFGRQPHANLSQSEWYPFKSYIGFLKYRKYSYLSDNIKNIILFIPVGYLLKKTLYINRIKLLKVGSFFSITIELLQVIMRVGFFQFDDIINNVIGIFVGYTIDWAKGNSMKLLFKRKSHKSTKNKCDIQIHCFKPDFLFNMFCPGETKKIKVFVSRVYFQLITKSNFYIYYVKDSVAEDIIHTSYVVGKCKKFRFLTMNDYEIGPCYTKETHRGKGIYPKVLEYIIVSRGTKNSNYYMIVDENNTSSIKGVKKAGFENDGTVRITKLKEYIKI